VENYYLAISSIPPNRVSNQVRGHIMEALNQASIAVLRALNAANDAPIEDIDDGYGEHDAVSRWIEQMERAYA
jgi:2-methylisocitrate lyase-like PEP mutase family enzyme